MGMQVVAGATMMCSFGAAPSVLSVLPTNRTVCGGPPAATIMDHIPAVNICPFGMCMSPSNPTVASATAAAWGVLTPMPCVPLTPSPWLPGSATVLVGGLPALDSLSKCICTWGGVISILVPGQLQVVLP